MRKTNLFIMAVFIMVVSASCLPHGPRFYSINTLSCELNTEPSIDFPRDDSKKIPITCRPNPIKFSHVRLCKSYIYDGSRLIQENPLGMNNQEMGSFITPYPYPLSFKMENMEVNGYYTTLDLEAGHTYNISMICLDPQWSEDTHQWTGQITPQYKHLKFIADRALWLKDNTNYLILGGFVSVIFIISGVLIYAIMRSKDE